MKRALGLILACAIVATTWAQGPSPMPFAVPYAVNGDDQLQTLQKILTTRACAHVLTVAPSNSTDLTHAGLLYVGGTGNVQVNTAGGETSVVLTAVPAGTLVPLVVTRVWVTNTTATNMVVLY
jgi:hypothetical protein